MNESSKKSHAFRSTYQSGDIFSKYNLLKFYFDKSVQEFHYNKGRVDNEDQV